jgi:hypothetical protein
MASLLKSECKTFLKKDEPKYTVHLAPGLGTFWISRLLLGGQALFFFSRADTLLGASRLQH